MAEGQENKPEWVMVFSSPDEFSVELHRAMLEEAGIKAVVVNKKDSRYMIGEMELYVDRSDAVRAIHLLEKGTIDE